MNSIKQYNLGGCTIVTDGTDFYGALLKWSQMAGHAKQFSPSLVWAFRVVVLAMLMRGISCACHLDDLKWQDINTKFHEDWFRC
jgi:hypothetical protein